jgi:plastocyanin
MKTKFTSLLALSVIAGSCSLSYAESADLKITFVYDEAKAPEAQKINMAKDELCGDPNLSDDTLVVDAESMGIANIVIYPDAKKSNIEVSDVAPDKIAKAQELVTLDNKDCVFAPKIFARLAGGQIKVTNSDKASHNANFGFFDNPAQNQIIPPGGFVVFDVKLKEKAPIPVECNIHSWMKAYVIVTELPLVGISNEKGELVIEGLPAGKEIQLKVWHQLGSFSTVNLDGKEVEWKKGAMPLTLKPGMNDLGVCKLKADTFKKK